MSDDLRERFDHYIGQLFTEEDDVLRWIQAEADRHELPQISVQVFDGYLLAWLVRFVRARRVVEIGTLAGYSGTWMARALPDDGKLYTVEKSAKHADVARRSFEHAGLEDKVEVHQGEALAILDNLSSKGPFDLVFIDADKTGYPDYLRWAVANLRSGGVVAAHNAYRSGRIFEPETDDDRGMAAFNEALAAHPELDGIIIPMGDGMAVGVKQ